jgi:hypothetical protein
MKKFSSLIGGIVLGTTLLAGQSYAQSTSQPPYGRGDQNKDGVCDVSGNPVGQGRRQGRGQSGTNLGANCPYGNPGAGQNTGGQNQRGAGQNRGGMGRGAGRR